MIIKIILLKKIIISLHVTYKVSFKFKDTNSDEENSKQNTDYVAIARSKTKTGMTPPQWINCDIS